MSRWVTGCLVTGCVLSACAATHSVVEAPLTSGIVYDYDGGRVMQWQPMGGKRTRASLPSGDSVTAVAALGDDTIVVGGDGLYVATGPAAILTRRQSWSPGPSVSGRLLTSPDRTRLLATASMQLPSRPEQTQQTWMLLSIDQAPKVMTPPVNGYSEALGFSADGQSVLVLVPSYPPGGTRTLERIELSTNTAQPILAAIPPGAAALSPDGSHIAVAAVLDPEVQIIDVRLAAQQSPLVTHLPAPAAAVVWGSDSSTLFIGIAPIRILQLGLQNVSAGVLPFADGGLPRAISPDGQYLLAAAGDHLNIVDTKTGRVSSTGVPLPGVFTWAQPAIPLHLPAVATQ